MSSDNVLLRVENLRKTFEQRELLNISNIDFAAGNSYVLTGDNGAGKTDRKSVV